MKVRSVETGMIKGIGLDTPPHQKSLKANRQNITRDIFQPTTKQLMRLMASAKLSNYSSGPVDKMDELCSARLLLGFIDGNAS